MLKQLKSIEQQKKESKRRKEIAKVYCNIEMYNGKEWKENKNETN